MAPSALEKEKHRSPDGVVPRRCGLRYLRLVALAQMSASSSRGCGSFKSPPWPRDWMIVLNSSFRKGAPELPYETSVGLESEPQSCFLIFQCAFKSPTICCHPVNSLVGGGLLSQLTFPSNSGHRACFLITTMKQNLFVFFSK